MSIVWPERLSLAQTPTPLQPLDRLSNQLAGPRIWIKRDDLTGSHLSGNKIRKLEFTLALAMKSGADCLITCGGLQSNHCRATALIGAQLGLPVHLVLRGSIREDVSDANLLLDQLAGANISCYPSEVYQTKLDKLLLDCAKHYRQKGFTPHIIPTGASDGLGVWGYLSATEELQRDFKLHQLQPDWIVCATGSGGTQAGLTLGNVCLGLGSKVLGIAVCDDAQYFQEKISTDINDFLACFSDRLVLPTLDLSREIHTNDIYIGEGYAKVSADVLETIHFVARTEGIVLDPVYTGKAFHGLLKEIQNGNLSRTKDVVFIHTGGIFGLFPYKDQFQTLLGSPKCKI